MKAEIEAKFLDVSFEEVRAKLQQFGAVCEQPMRTMRRVTIDNEFMKTGKDAFLRVRDEGHRATMTYKQFDDLTVDGVKEIEIEVSDFETTLQLLEQVGLVPGSYQETRRETWRLGEAEVVLDEWPWLKPFLEIEASTERRVRELAALLGFDWNEAVFGDVMVAYRAEYPHLTLEDTVGRVPLVKFDEPLPDLLKGAVAK